MIFKHRESVLYVFMALKRTFAIQIFFPGEKLGKVCHHWMQIFKNYSKCFCSLYDDARCSFHFFKKTRNKSEVDFRESNLMRRNFWCSSVHFSGFWNFSSLLSFRIFILKQTNMRECIVTSYSSEASFRIQRTDIFLSLLLWCIKDTHKKNFQ